MTQRQTNKIFTEIGALRLSVRKNKREAAVLEARIETLLNKLERESK